MAEPALLRRGRNDVSGLIQAARFNRTDSVGLTGRADAAPHGADVADRANLDAAGLVHGNSDAMRTASSRFAASMML